MIHYFIQLNPGISFYSVHTLDKVHLGIFPKNRLSEDFGRITKGST